MSALGAEGLLGAEDGRARVLPGLKRAGARRLNSRHQTRGGGRGGCAFVAFSLSAATVAKRDGAAKGGNSIAATMLADKGVHSSAQAPDASQLFFVCRLQFSASGQQWPSVAAPDMWVSHEAVSSMPAIIDACIAAAGTGKPASARAIIAVMAARIFCMLRHRTGPRLFGSSELIVRGTYP